MRPLLASLLALGLCAQAPEQHILLASTIGPIDAGILDDLETAFTKETGIVVRHVGAGTGATLEMARKGGFDLVLVHAKTLEEAFVAEGFGTRRIPLMYNDFVILGPAADPAGIKHLSRASDALKAIAAKGAPFLTRGDQSGTHVAELGLWKQAGLTPKGAWYQVFERGAEGNTATLKAADARQCYTVIDRATYLSLKPTLKLALLLEKDEALLNRITLIPINPARFPRTEAAAAQAFVAWLTHRDKGQKRIAAFGQDRFGQSLFFPDAKE